MIYHRVNAVEAIRAIQKIEAELLAAVRQALGQAAAHAAFLARQTTSFKDHTGALRGSITRGSKGPWVHFVRAGGPKARYALFVEEGTRAHVIAARRKTTLRFVADGQVLFRRRVNHPGTKARHFLREAAEHAEHTLVRFIEAGAMRVLQ